MSDSATDAAASEIDGLLAEVSARHPETDLAPIRRAYATLEHDASAQERTVALRAAAQLAGLRIDPAAITACLLSHGADDSDTGHVREKFGEDVAGLLDGVRKLERVHWDALGRESAETLRRMFMSMAADVRVVVLVLVERLQTMRALRDEPDAERRHRIARETLTVFAPLANRLGIAQIKWELEDLALRELQPDVYAELKQALAEKRSERDAYVEEVQTILRDLMREHGIRGEVTGRPKHIYSIYDKMRRKEVGFDQIYDVTAVRVLVDEIKDCYAMLGLVHGLWVPIPGEFDDYIARPKANFYQSLHTAVSGPDGKSVEIQIRTRDMHEFAEFGVAAHWAYKEGRRTRSADAQFNLLRQLVSWQSALDADDRARLDEKIFADRVYVLTPEGDVIDLPAGATPLDFAYRVHTMVGHRCRGAKVNGQIVPLDRALQTGDQIEILTRKQPEPSRDWLNPQSGYLETNAARQKVRQWFRQQSKEASTAEGKTLLERELTRLGLPFPDADPLDEVALELNQDSSDDLLAAIGFGDVGAHTVANRLRKRLEPEPAPVPVPPEQTSQRKRRRTAAGVRVDGVSNVLGHPARCCGPVPGDPVIGYVTRGRGVMIHHRDCPNIVNSREPERLIDVDWGGEGRRTYPVRLRVTVLDRPGSFRDVADVISNHGINISASRTQSRGREDAADLTLTLEVRERDQIDRVIERLNRLPVVLGVRRR